MRTLRYLNTVLTIIACLLTLQLWTAWHSPTEVPLDHADQAQAAGGIPNSGAQREEMIDELKKLNTNMDKLSKALTSDELKVKVVNISDLKSDDE